MESRPRHWILRRGCKEYTAELHFLCVSSRRQRSSSQGQLCLIYQLRTEFVYITRYPISKSGRQTGPLEVITNLTFNGADDFTVFPGLFDAVLLANDPGNGIFFQYQDCLKRLATTNGTTANKIAWSQLKPNGSVPVFVTSESGVEACGALGPYKSWRSAKCVGDGSG